MMASHCLNILFLFFAAVASNLDSALVSKQDWQDAAKNRNDCRFLHKWGQKDEESERKSRCLLQRRTDGHDGNDLKKKAHDRAREMRGCLDARTRGMTTKERGRQ